MELQSSLFKNLRFIYSNINHFGIPHNNWESQMLIEKETLPKIEENTVQNKTIGWCFKKYADYILTTIEIS